VLKYFRNIEGFYILDLFGLELPNFPADVTVWWVQLMSRTAELLCVFAADPGLMLSSVYIQFKTIVL
jgi:hypothetical protein